MAQRVLGIDLGAHTIKMAEVEVGFRVTRLVHLNTFGVPSGPEPCLERGLKALGQMGEVSGQFDMVAVGMPGDTYLYRVFNMPFTDQRKVAAVVANQLVDDIPWELEDVVFDHYSLLAPAGKVLAVAARSQEVAHLLERLAALNIEPRTLPPAPLAYGRLIRNLEPDAPVLVIDMGHQRTNVSFLMAGRPLSARTISRGGHQITEAFQQAFHLPYHEAEQVKEQRAFLPQGESLEGLDEVGRSIAMVTRESLEQLVRELRLTVGLFAGQIGLRPERVFLCGGTSLLQGMEQYVGAQLEIPCQRMDLSAVEDFQVSNVTGDGQAVGALSMALCLEQGGLQGLDLRQGEFSYRTDQSVFREKLLTLAVSTVLILVFLVANAIASAVALRKEEKILKAQLKKTSRVVFGKVVSNPRKVSRLVRKGALSSSAGIPVKTAFDVLNMISSQIPAADKVKLDVTRLDIKAGRTFIKGTANSRSEIGEIIKSLKAVSCFDKVTSGKVSEVAEGKKSFSVTLSTNCF